MKLKLSCKQLLLFSVFIVGNCVAAVNFGARQSAIKVADGATLNVNTAMNITDGSLVREDRIGSAITGATISFSKGILESEDSESLMTADYDPTGEDQRGGGAIQSDRGDPYGQQLSCGVFCSTGTYTNWISMAAT